MTPKGKNTPHKYTLIFLHGLADNADGLLSLFLEDELNPHLPEYPDWEGDNFKIVLPTAPIIPITMHD